MLFMAVFHPGPWDSPGRPMRWQHGATSGVTVHGAWISAGFGTETLSDQRVYVVFECEAEQAAAFVNYLRPVYPTIEMRTVTDYLPNMRAYERGEPEQRPRGPNVTDEQWRIGNDNIKRYIEAPNANEALRIWMETDGPVGGAQPFGNSR
jgi:hypothetical protein